MSCGTTTIAACVVVEMFGFSGLTALYVTGVNPASSPAGTLGPQLEGAIVRVVLGALNIVRLIAVAKTVFLMRCGKVARFGN